MTSIREAERAVLGSMMISPRAAEDCTTILGSGDFSEWQHADIFSAVVSLLEAGMPHDVIAVTDRLIAQGDIERLGGAATLHRLTDEVATASNASYYATLVKRAAQRRRISEIGQSLIDTVANDGAAEADQLAIWAREQIDSVLNITADEAQPMSWDYDDMVASLAEPADYTPTPWEDLNPIIDGWRPGALYVFGARPGGGKSLAGVQAAMGLAEHGAVALISLEMGRPEIQKRMTAAMAGVSLKALVRNDLEPYQWDAISMYRDRIAQLPVYISERSGLDMVGIRNYVRGVARRGNLAGVVVDYLQLVRGDAHRPRWEAVGEITRELKALAREYRVPVIALSQLNRRTEGGNARPGLGDLRESGAIEQDSDVAILLNRLMDPDTEEYGDEIEFVVAKNRHGSTGVVTLWWEGMYARVSDMKKWIDNEARRWA